MILITAQFFYLKNSDQQPERSIIFQLNYAYLKKKLAHPAPHGLDFQRNKSCINISYKQRHPISTSEWSKYEMFKMSLS